MPTIDAIHFVPRSKATGSIDPYGTCCSEHVFHLTQGRWGVTATQIQMANQVRLLFPVTVSQVVAGSEADEQGIRKGDRIVAVGLDGHGCQPVKVSLTCCSSIFSHGHGAQSICCVLNSKAHRRARSWASRLSTKRRTAS